MCVCEKEIQFNQLQQATEKDRHSLSQINEVEPEVYGRSNSKTPTSFSLTRSGVVKLTVSVTEFGCKFNACGVIPEIRPVFKCTDKIKIIECNTSVKTNLQV